MSYRRVLYAPLTAACLLAACLLGWGPAHASKGTIKPTEAWFDFKFQNVKVGFLQSLDERTTVNDQPAIHMRRWSVVQVKRESNTIRMDSTTDAWTDLEGRPLRFKHVRMEGKDERVIEGHRDAKDLVITKNIGGQVVTSRLPLSGDLFAAASLDGLFNTGLAVGKTITGKAVVEDEGEIRDFTIKVTGTEKTPEGTAFVVTMSINGVDSRELVLADGRTLKAEIPALGAEFVATTREKAMELGESFDIFSSALFKLSSPLPSGEQIEELVVHLAGKSGDRPIYVSDKRQRARALGKSEVELRIRPDAPPIKPPQLPYAGASVRAYLKETPHEALKDPRLVEVAHEVVGGEKNAWEAARKINAFVNRHISKKTLARAFATASEALETGEGDCTEHAVLFSALAKISGIPTKLITGLVYVGGNSNVFGYHEWVEVWMGDRWIAMDPTFGQDVADATHIKFTQGQSDADGLRDAGIAAAKLIKDLELKVAAYTTVAGDKKVL